MLGVLILTTRVSLFSISPSSAILTLLTTMTYSVSDAPRYRVLFEIGVLNAHPDRGALSIAQAFVGDLSELVTHTFGTGHGPVCFSRETVLIPYILCSFDFQLTMHWTSCPLRCTANP